jgi:hypothetical protein
MCLMPPPWAIQPARLTPASSVSARLSLQHARGHDPTSILSQP